MLGCIATGWAYACLLRTYNYELMSRPQTVLPHVTHEDLFLVLEVARKNNTQITGVVV